MFRSTRRPSASSTRTASSSPKARLHPSRMTWPNGSQPPGWRLPASGSRPVHSRRGCTRGCGPRGCGPQAICIETRRMKGATAAMAVKTDRNDARAIAHAMRVGWFTAVHVKTAESQELRLLLSNRRTLLEKRVAIDNEIRGTLKAFGLKLGAVTVAAFEARAPGAAR